MLPHAPGKCLRRAAMLALGLLAAGAAHGQVRPMSLTQTNSQFGTGSTSAMFGQGSSGKTPMLDQSVNGQRIVMGMYGGGSQLSTFNNQQGPYDNHTSFTGTKSLDVKMMNQPEMREPTMDRINGEQSALSHYTDYSEWKHPSGSPKFSDSWVLHSGQPTGNSLDSTPELSLQDINRYEFRASRSSEPGLPVTHAGGDTDTPSSGGQLVNTPALFDFSGSKGGINTQTGSVHSGGMVAPKMMTPDGESQAIEPRFHEVSSSSAPKPPPTAPAPVPGSAAGPVPDLTPKSSYAPMDPSRMDEVQLGKPQVWATVKPE